jgi:alkylhydroperoxidase family enzyme
MRIAPLEPPYEPEVADQLRSMMPAGVEPIALFRTLAKNPPMARASQAWARHELGRTLSVGMREREIVIDRTCVRCGCEYEWGVHVAYFAERASLSPQQVASIAHGDHRDPCWATERDRLLIRLVDALHDDHDVDDALWAELAAELTEAQILDLLLLCGWYHAISFTARAARVPLEPWAPTFASVAPVRPCGAPPLDRT